jgi:hypothetical protein
MTHQPILVNFSPLVVIWLVLIVVFRFAANTSAWRAIVYETAISLALFLIVVVFVNWYSATH